MPGSSGLPRRRWTAKALRAGASGGPLEAASTTWAGGANSAPTSLAGRCLPPPPSANDFQPAKRRTTMPVFDTPAPISALIELGVGDLRVVASDRSDTVVEVRPTNPSKQSDITAAE